MLKIEHVTARIPVPEYIRKYRDADRFIAFCQACDSYNSCWACPPFSFDPLKRLLEYKTLYLIGTKITPNESLRSEPRAAAQNRSLSRSILASVRKELDQRLLALEADHPDSLTFFAGTCFSCPHGKCTRIEEIPCVQPERMRHSLESFGFDIGQSASDLLGIELKWSANGALPEYFTLVSGIATNDDLSQSEGPLLFSFECPSFY